MVISKNLIPAKIGNFMSRPERANELLKRMNESISKKSIQFIFFIILSYAWTTITSSFLAADWGWTVNNHRMTTMRLAQIFSVPLLACALLLIVNSKFFLNSKKHIFLVFIYLLKNLTLFFSVAPGCFTEDTFYTFHMVKNGWWEGWYSPLHPFFMTGLIQIIPWGFNAPGFFLALLWSVVYVFAHIILSKLSAPRIVHAGLFFLSFIPAQLASLLIVVRDSYFTALFILFILHFFYLAAVKKDINYPGFIALVGMGALLSFYRSDAFPSILVGIFLISYIYIKKNQSPIIFRKVFLSVAIPFLTVYLVSSLPSNFLKRDWVQGGTWGKRAELEYKLTLIENPLGYIVRNNGVITSEQITNIERVFSIKDLRQHWCPQNLCLFYGGHWIKESSFKDRKTAFISALLVFFQNPRLFILSRLETLNTVGDRNTQTMCSLAKQENRGFPKLLDFSILTSVGDVSLRLIKGTETKDGAFGGKNIWWNVYFSALTLASVLVFFKLAPISGLISIMMLLRSFAVFIAAPAGFTVYYTTLFIGAPLIFFLFICEGYRNFKNSEESQGL